jgi:hypothetical protein
MIMNKEQARTIVKSTFENPFDRNRFIPFIGNLLNSFEDSSFSHKGNLIPDAYEQHISLFERIGKYTDGEHRIDILVVKLKRDDSIERARTMQRNFVARYLNGSRGGELRDAALVAFVAPDNQDWRFSLVKMDYRFEDGKDGKVKVKEEFTPARRWSFLVGANEKSHTAQTQLVRIIMDDKRNPTLEELEEAFNIEKATKEFFNKYRDLFLWTKEELDKIVEADQKVKTDFDKQNVNTVDFAKKLLGQIVFLYFLQKKGWFGVERDKAWGTGSKRFLRDLFDGRIIEYKNFFNDVLEPLFYDALARDRSDVGHFNPLFKCKIPFLNGGLFDPINDYDWAYTDILLPNELFSNTIKTKEGDIGNGILDVFDRFNFTVKEDEPLEKEVAVDPEMLGKVFENLLEVKDRKSKGTYYTPREIVHFMCQQSLIDYLLTQLEGEVRKEAIEFLVLKGEEYIEYLKTAKEKKEEGQKSERYKENEYFIELRKYAEDIDNSLSDIKVCDPAIGSGAFPVGMMTEITKARLFLSETKCLSDSYKDTEGDEFKRNAYNYKRECIEKSLYGVDIDPGAVEIAKLRLWLSLVVDEEDIRQIQPLPNLDYKVMQGDTLIEKYEGIELIDDKFLTKGATREQLLEEMREEKRELERELINLYNQNKLTSTRKNQLETRISSLAARIQDYRDQDVIPAENLSLFGIDLVRRKADKLLELQNKFFATFQKTAKDKLKDEIENLTWELIEATLRKQGKEDKIGEISEFRKTNSRPFFLWKLHFAEVFHENNGFDVVIANPPYSQIQTKPENEKELLRLQAYRTYTRTGDLYCLFYERSNQLIRPHGVVCFISSNSWMRTKYGELLRRYFVEHTNPIQLLNFEDSQIFESAIVETNVLLTRNERNEQRLRALNMTGVLPAENAIFEYFIKECTTLSDLSADAWTIGSKADIHLKIKIESGSKALGNLDVGIFRGITSGFNDAFYVDANKRHEIAEQEPQSRQFFKPALRGKDLHKFNFSWPGLCVIRIGAGWTNAQKPEHDPEEFFKRNHPLVYRHLKSIGDSLTGKGKGLYDRDDQGDYWWELRPCAYYEEFEKEKIMWIVLSDKGKFAYDDKGFYTNDSIFIITGRNLKYLMAILNSKLSQWYVKHISTSSGMGTTMWKKYKIEQFPIREVSPTKQQPLHTLVDRILAITNDEDYSLKPPMQAKVKALQRRIDRLVYELYGLTPEEIAIVEQETAAANS